MQHLHAPDSDHFYIELFEAEQVMDIFKIEHDIIDTLSFGSKNIGIIPSPFWVQVYMLLCTNYTSSS